MKDCRIINLWGGPGARKSTTAAGLFNLMKQLGLKVELVTEFAKDLTYERNLVALQNQLLILGTQDHRLRSVADHVDFIITDSPLPLGIAYLTPEYEWLEQAILDAYHRYDNWDFRLVRPANATYQTYGRNQTEHEALALDIQIRDIFNRATGFVDLGGDSDEPSRQAEEDVQEWEVPANYLAPYTILRHLGVSTESLDVRAS